MTQSKDDQHTPSVTDDGSQTIYSRKFNQHFHSPRGAIMESRHVFFEEPGLLIDLQKRPHLNIAETGFGTGLNLLLLAEYIENLNCSLKIDYYAVEGYPISAELADKLDYHRHLDHVPALPRLSDIFADLKPGINKKQINDCITLTLFIGTFDEWQLPDKSIDYFFHDPFSIEVNPDGWTVELFSKLMKAAEYHATLTTYSAAVKARAAMAAAGWQLASAPGALSKREMTIASPDAFQLKGFKLLNNAKLRQRYDEEFSRQT